MLIWLLFSSLALADSALVELPDHSQQLVQVDKSTTLSASAAVLCDERAGCVMPSQIVLGAMIKNADGSVSVDANKKAAIDSAKSAEEAEKTDFAALKAKIVAETATAAEIRRAFKFLLKKLGE